MSVMLYLMRHGIAEDAGAEVTDFDRALTPEGVRKTTQVAQGLRMFGLRPDAILSSPLRRALETARIAASVLAPDCEVRVTPALAAGTAARSIVADLRLPRGASHVLLVGHQPDLGELASHLLTGAAQRVPLPFKKAAVAAIEVDGIPPSSTGILHWFAPAGLLRLVDQK